MHRRHEKKTENGSWSIIRNKENLAPLRREAVMDMQRFVAEQNIAGYRSWLEEDGAERVTRAILVKLWLREEGMLGLTREQLTRINRHIEKLRRLIAEQSKR